MKTKLSLTLLLSLVFCLFSFPQVPQGFNYQAIARDAGGNLITTAFDIKVEIQNLAADTVFWIEEHTVTPNEFGLISFIVGESGRIGGTALLFEDIDWSSHPRYLKTSANTGSGYTVMGIAQIMSVPYSLVAKEVTGPVENLNIVGTTEDMDEALFEVRNKDGQVIFAVYNEGVRIYVEDEAKGPKGGFAIGSFGTTKEGESQPLFIVKPDTVRIYINQTGKGPKGGFAIGGYGIDKTEPQNFLFVSDDSVRIYIDNADTDLKGVKGGFAIGGYGLVKGKPQDLFMVSNDSVRVYIDKAEEDKGPKGGFAIGGFGTTKGKEEEYLRVTRDSTRVYVSESAKASSGGFAIGGLGAVPGNVTPFTSLTPDNYFIGHKSGINNTTGIRNSFVGYETGVENDTGSYNVFLGYRAGYGSISSYNTFIGYQSGSNNTTGKYNALMGYRSGINNKTGNNNVYIGYLAGEGPAEGSSGSRNVCLGNYAGNSIKTGYQNVFIGNESGKRSQLGWQNVFIGDSAGAYTEAAGEVYIGYGVAAFPNYREEENVLIGCLAGYSFNGGYSVVIGSHSAEYGGAFKSVLIGDRAGQYSGFIDKVTRNTHTDLIFIGHEAGHYNQGDNNIFIGTSAGQGNGANNNIFIGNNAGFLNSGNDNLSGCSNIFIGNNSGFSNYSGMKNTIIGDKAGYSLLIGNSNIFIGTETGYNNTSGEGNVFIGYKTGINNNGTRNIFLGNMVGGSQKGSNRLIIDNWDADSSKAFIWGNLETDQLRLNSNIGIGANPDEHNLSVFNGYGRGTINVKGIGDAYEYANISLESGETPDSYLISHDASHSFRIFYWDGMSMLSRILIDPNGNVTLNNPTPGTETLDVNGNARFRAVGSGTFGYDLNIMSDGTLTTSTSDISMKSNIEQISDALDKILRLNGVYFNWKDDEDGVRQIGMIAQEVEPIVPEIVFTNPVDGLKGINYSQTAALFIEAIKEQQQQIDSQEQQIESQQQQIEELKAMVEKLMVR